jgi:hypothetical protein
MGWYIMMCASCRRWCAWWVWCAGRLCPRLRLREHVEAGQRLVQVVLVSPGWRVMLAERKSAEPVASLWVLEALCRRIPGLNVDD